MAGANEDCLDEDNLLLQELTTTGTSERSDVQHSVYVGNNGVTYMWTGLGTEHADWARNSRKEMRKEDMREEKNKRLEEDKNIKEKRLEENKN
eukprot:15485027-Heterocapsa_arctica.AAC.1